MKLHKVFHKRIAGLAPWLVSLLRLGLNKHLAAWLVSLLRLGLNKHIAALPVSLLRLGLNKELPLGWQLRMNARTPIPELEYTNWSSYVVQVAAAVIRHGSP